MQTENRNIIQNLAAEITEYPYLDEIEHKHSRYEIRCFITADADMTIDGKTYKITDGDTVVIGAECIHKLNSPDKICFVSFFGMEESFDEINPDSHMTFMQIIKKKHLQHIAERAYTELIKKEAFFNENLKALRSELAIELIRFCTLPFSSEETTPSHYQITASVNKYLNLHFKEKIKLEDISEYTGFNKSYLSRIYKQNAGCTVWFRLGYLRVEYAKHLIETTNKSLEEISQMCGFENNSYFRKLFKDHTGLTPSVYRKMI